MKRGLLTFRHIAKGLAEDASEETRAVIDELLSAYRKDMRVATKMANDELSGARRLGKKMTRLEVENRRLTERLSFQSPIALRLKDAILKLMAKKARLEQDIKKAERFLIEAGADLKRLRAWAGDESDANSDTWRARHTKCANEYAELKKELDAANLRIRVLSGEFSKAA